MKDKIGAPLKVGDRVFMINFQEQAVVIKLFPLNRYVKVQVQGRKKPYRTNKEPWDLINLEPHAAMYPELFL